MADLPPEEKRERRNRQTRYIAILALAVAIGHVVYAAVRDHVFGGWVPWWFLGPPP